jgi:PadR family transcriptional regulator PadR
MAVRLSGPTLRVLKLFLAAPRKERSGAQITRETKIGAGTLYPLLARLEQHGWLKAEWEQVPASELGRPRKRLYCLTGLGQTQAIEAFSEFQLPQGEPAWVS